MLSHKKQSLETYELMLEVKPFTIHCLSDIFTYIQSNPPHTEFNFWCSIANTAKTITSTPPAPQTIFEHKIQPILLSHSPDTMLFNTKELYLSENNH